MRFHVAGIAVDLRAGFAVPLVLLWFSGGVVSALAQDWARVNGQASSAIDGQAASLVFVCAVLGFICCHEAGHVLAGIALGHRLIGVTLASKVMVHLDYSELTRWRRGFVSASGPLAELAVALTVILIGGPWSEPWVLAGWFSAATATLAFFCWWPSSDGGRFWRAIFGSARR